MAPPAGPRRHHCLFKMPHNPQYGCPRAGNMYQVSGNVYYCSYHDKYAQDRCQAFFDFQGSGMQCPELHVMIDQDTGRKYCEKHEPSSAIPAVIDWKARMTEWLTGVASTESPREEGDSLLEDVASEGESAITEPQPQQESELEHHAKTKIRPETKSDIELKSKAETKPDIESDTGTETAAKQDAQDMEATLPDHYLSAGKLEAEKEPDQPPESDVKQQADQKPEMTSESQPSPVHQHEHIAALYLQCNICLESHNAADMTKIESCGHQYKESCLQDFLRRKGVRKYNCAGCRAWLSSHHEQL